MLWYFVKTAFDNRVGIVVWRNHIGNTSKKLPLRSCQCILFMAAVTVFWACYAALFLLSVRVFTLMKIRILPNTVINRLADRSAGGMSFRLNKHVLLVKCGNSLCHFFYSWCDGRFWFEQILIVWLIICNHCLLYSFHFIVSFVLLLFFS